MVVKLSMASEFLYNYITCKSLELVFEASLWHVEGTQGILKLIGVGCVLKNWVSQRWKSLIVAVTEFDGVIALLTYLCIYFQLIFF